MYVEIRTQTAANRTKKAPPLRRRFTVQSKKRSLRLVSHKPQLIMDDIIRIARDHVFFVRWNDDDFHLGLL